MLTKKKSLWNYMKHHKALYFMVLPGLLLLIIFKYLPMYGLIVSFQDFRPPLGYLGSEFVGLKHFRAFFADPFSLRIIKNTFLIGLYSLIFSFPASIILALIINELRFNKFKRVVQTISYMPYFISVVIVVGLIKNFFGTSDGLINELLINGGIINEGIPFLQDPKWFRTLYISTGIWQGIGFGSIIYLGALANINGELYEAAIMDGATRMQRIWHVTLPGIMPTMTVLFIMAVGNVLGNDYQKILLMYSPSTYPTADVLNTYIYRFGVAGGSFSYASAVGLLAGIVSLIMLAAANFVASRTGDTALY